MNTLMNLDPWNFLDDMLDTGGNIFRSMRARAAGRFPPINIYIDDDAMIVDARLPGATAKTVELSLEPQAVVLSDRPAAAEGEEGKDGAAKKAPAWSRRIELPFRADAAKANAKFENGILRIELPKAEADGVRRIAIA